jgi:molybdate transport system substrate-binding protein
MRTRIFPIAIAAALCAALAIAPARADQTVQIAAAANLIKVFNERIIPAFAKKTGITVLPTFGATGLLARQVESGAPYEVFVSADVDTVRKLAAENLLDPKSVKVYAVGRLALWSKSLPVAIAGLNVLTQRSVINVAVANPETAPYGAATIETLTKLKMLERVKPKIVYAENIGQALQYAQSGNADVAFTALSLLMGNVGGSYFIVGDNLHAPIAQAVGFARSASPRARRFEEFLLSKECRKIFAAAGYLAPPSSR